MKTFLSALCRFLKDTGRKHRLLLYTAVLLLLGGCAALFLLPQKPVPNPIPTPPYVIAIDAGHGGTDPGAVGYFREVDLTEATAVYLEYLLLQDANYRPFLCRKTGTDAALADRTDKANAEGADLYLSIHANSAAEDENASGFECYPSLPDRKWGAESLSLAQCCAARMQATGAPLRGEGGVRYIWYVKDGKGGYEKRTGECSQRIPSRYRSFAVLEDVDCPSVLLEQCFVTNPEDAAFWGTDAGYRTAAQAYYYAVCDYFGTEPVAF